MSLSVSRKKVTDNRRALMDLLESARRVPAISSADIVKALEDFIDAKIEMHEIDMHGDPDDQ